MNPARTSVKMTAVTSRMRRRRFHLVRWGSKNICLSGISSRLYSTNRMEADPLSQSMETVTAGNRTRTVLSIVPALLAGALLRLWMLKHFFEVTGDALVYGGIAKNLLLSGRYALTVGTGETYPTLIRLPGYPLFLAACFKIFGMEKYGSAAYVQIVLDLVACLLLADVAGRVAPERLKGGAGYCTLWLAALCPFTAVYVANPLTEGLTLFTIALAMWSAVRFEE